MTHILVVKGSATHALLSLCRRDYQGRSYLSLQVDYLQVNTSGWTAEQHHAIDQCHVTGIEVVAKRFQSDPLDVAGFYGSWQDEMNHPTYGEINAIFVPSGTTFHDLLQRNDFAEFLDLLPKTALDAATGPDNGNEPAKVGTRAQRRHNRKHKSKPHVYTASERGAADQLTSPAVQIAHTFDQKNATARTGKATAEDEGGPITDHKKLKRALMHPKRREGKFVPYVWTVGDLQGDDVVYAGKGTCLTVLNHKEGFGSEYHSVITGYTLALHRKWKYCQSRHTKYDHDLDSARCQGMMGFNPQDCSNCVSLTKGHLRSVVKKLHGLHKAGNEAMPKIRERFRLGASKVLNQPVPSKACKYAAGRTSIAVHIRRGDIQSTGYNKDRYVNGTIFTKQMRLLHEELAAADRRAMFHVYSEGTPEQIEDTWQQELDAANIRADDIMYHMDEDPLLSFYCLVVADRLITGGSTFSEIASKIGTGTSYHLNDNHDSF